MNFWKICYYKILSKRSTFIHFIQPFPTLNQNPGFLRLSILITDLNNMDMVNLLTLSAVIYKTFFIKNYCVHKYSEENIKKDACVSEWQHLCSFFEISSFNNLFEFQCAQIAPLKFKTINFSALYFFLTKAFMLGHCRCQWTINDWNIDRRLDHVVCNGGFKLSLVTLNCVERSSLPWENTAVSKCQT